VPHRVDQRPAGSPKSWPLRPLTRVATTLGTIQHWNGTSWTMLNATTQTGAAVTVSALAALSSSDV